MASERKIINRVSVEDDLLGRSGWSTLARTRSEDDTQVRYSKQVDRRGTTRWMAVEVKICFGTGIVVVDVFDADGENGWSATFDGGVPNEVVKAAVHAGEMTARKG